MILICFGDSATEGAVSHHYPRYIEEWIDISDDENSLSILSEKDPCCGGSVVYGFRFGEGVKGTPFGQTANMLSGGCLAEYDKQPANLFSIGSH